MIYGEWAAVLLNVAYVILVSRRIRLGWVFGGVASAISVVLFYWALLPSEAFLYLFYTVMAIYGFVTWQAKAEEVEIVQWDLKNHVITIASGVALAGIFYMYSQYFQDAAKPVLDAFTTSFSILATFMVVWRVLSNWIYWIIIDLVTVYLYVSRGLDVYAIQMGVFAILALLGYLQWKKQIQA